MTRLFVLLDGRDGLDIRWSTKRASSSVRPKFSVSVKLAGEFRLGRSGNRGDSVERSRLGDRGFVVASSSLDWLDWLASLEGIGGVLIDLGDRGGFIGGKKEPFGTLPDDCAAPRLPSAKPLSFSNWRLNCS